MAKQSLYGVLITLIPTPNHFIFYEHTTSYVTLLANANPLSYYTLAAETVKVKNISGQDVDRRGRALVRKRGN